MPNFFTYDRDGRIDSVGSVPKSWLPYQIPIDEEGGVMVGSANAKTQYVLNGELVSRPEMPFEQNGTTFTVPAKTKFTVKGVVNMEGTTEDGVIEFEFSEPGTYIVKLTNFPYLDAEVTLESHS